MGYICRARPLGKECGHYNPAPSTDRMSGQECCDECGRTRKASNDRIVHDPNGRGTNVLCYNGNAHRRTSIHKKDITCPACLMIHRTGCSAGEAVKAWDEPVPKGWLGV